MTTDDFIKKTEAKIAEILKENKPLELAVKSIMAVQSKRIWIDGKDKGGNDIGQYVGGEIYVSPNIDKNEKRKLPAFPLKGKDGEINFKNGKKHRTGYFANYLAFKKSIGRNKNKNSVDLLLTGTLQQNWSNADSPSNSKAIKISPTNYVVRLDERNMAKVERYNGSDNRVFGLSTKEKQQFLDVIRFELSKSLKSV